MQSSVYFKPLLDDLYYLMQYELCDNSCYTVFFLYCTPTLLVVFSYNSFSKFLNLYKMNRFHIFYIHRYKATMLLLTLPCLLALQLLCFLIPFSFPLQVLQMIYFFIFICIACSFVHVCEIQKVITQTNFNETFLYVFS